MEQTLNQFLHWLNKTNWSDLPGWMVILVLALAAIGALVVLRNVVFGGRGGGGGGSSTVVMPPTEGRIRGPYSSQSYPRTNVRFTPGTVYDFRMPSPAIKTDGLRQPISMDMDLASKLFIPPTRKETRQSELEALMQSKPLRYTQPNWKLAQRLFVPGFQSKESNDIPKKD